MHHFDYRDDLLHAEGVSLQQIADAVGTPTYVYSHATLARHLRVFGEALASHGVPRPHGARNRRDSWCWTSARATPS